MALQLMAALVSALAVGLFVLALLRRNEYSPEDARLQRLAERPNVRRGLSWEELRRVGPSSLPILRTVLVDSAWAKRTTLQIEQSGLKLRVGEYLTARIALALLSFVIIAMLGKSSVTTILGIVVAVFAYMVPAIYLSVLRRRRMSQFAKQLPEAVVMLGNALRAGFAFQHGVALVAEQMEAPTSEEFNRMMIDMNIGASVEDALHGLLERMDCEEVNLVVTAVLVQRTSGGNLAEILDNVGEQMRERERLYGEVRTMTSQQRFTGSVMSFWPLILLGLMALLNWDQTRLLFTTSGGLIMLCVGIGLQFLGFFTIQRILDVEI
jgi:tight adherence protein B